MKLESIRGYLKPYSVYQKRKTTINHAFAAALAPFDAFDRERVLAAMRVLGQTDMDDLACVYCNAAAEEWDHLTSIAKDSQLNGFGHQISNLVPCCSRCNRSKGNEPWEDFLRLSLPDVAQRELRQSAIGNYLSEFATSIDLAKLQANEAEWRRYVEIKLEILKLMQEADDLAGVLRNSH